MRLPKLINAVTSVDGQELLPAGSEITPAILDKLIRSYPQPLPAPQSMLEHGDIAGDLETFLQSEPYSRIFADEETTTIVKTLMGEVRLPPAVLQSLDYFKANDPYTYRHIMLVFAISTRLILDFVSDSQDLISEATTGPTHDFGKICMPLSILTKSSPLTETERSILQQHTLAGYVLLAYYFQDSNHLAARVALDHHEKRDGSGYPRGIALEDRIVEIVAVSDVYDALISPRPYRGASYDNRTALEEITCLAQDGKFDVEVVRALIACNRSSRPSPADCYVSDEQRGTPPSESCYGQTAPEEQETVSD
ncbi:MAG: HD domain-containing phosphohydrolase [bacterium]